MDQEVKDSAAGDAEGKVNMVNSWRADHWVQNELGGFGWEIWRFELERGSLKRYLWLWLYSTFSDPNERNIARHLGKRYDRPSNLFNNKAQAQSGTGKTATFTIGILQNIDFKQERTQALVVAPTRELSQQISFVIQQIGEFCGVKVHSCVGGTTVREDIKILKSGVHVVVGTPGRVHDMMKKGFL